MANTSLRKVSNSSNFSLVDTLNGPRRRRQAQISDVNTPTNATIELNLADLVATTTETTTTSKAKEHFKKPQISDAGVLQQDHITKPPLVDDKNKKPPILDPAATTISYMEEMQQLKYNALETFNKCTQHLNQTCLFSVNNCADTNVTLPLNFLGAATRMAQTVYNCDYKYYFYESMNSTLVLNRTQAFWADLNESQGECSALALAEYSFLYNKSFDSLNIAANCFNLSLIEELRSSNETSKLKCALREYLAVSDATADKANGIIKECELTVNSCESNEFFCFLC